MEQLLLQDLAAANEQRVRSKKERDRLRKQLKRKRFDGFTFVQRRIALILYIIEDFDKLPALFYLLNLMRILPYDTTDGDNDGLLRVLEECFWFALMLK